MRITPLWFLVAVGLAAIAAIHDPAIALPPPSPGEFETTVQPYLTTYCLRCHDAKKHKGDFRLDTLTRDFASGGSGAKWREIVERISSGEMPPEDERQPAAEESARVVERLAAHLRDAEAARLATRERVSFHRLTREEYANTIAELLGVPFDATDPNGLPDDPEWHGFERLGSVLSVSPSHIEKYFAAAETVLSEAFPAKVPDKFVRRKDAIELRGGPDRAALTAQGLANKVRVDLWPGSNLEGGRIGPGIALPAAGFYKVRVKLSGLKPAGGRAPHLTFYTVNLDRMLFEHDVIAAEDQPVIVEFTAHLPAGNHNFRLTNDVPGPSNLPRSGRADPRRPFFSIKEGRRPWQIKLTDESGVPIMPFLILDWVEWEGPIAEPGPTFAQRQYMPEGKDDPTPLREALTRFEETRSMSNILGQKWLLNRRHFLRGAGAMVALPLLDCMTPLRAAVAATDTRRNVFVYIPNGVNVLTWQITEAGAGYTLSDPLKPLERHRANITPISGLHHPHGIGQAHECAKIWLTGAKISQEGGAFRNTVSCDQLMAEVTAPKTRFGSLELSISRGDTTLGLVPVDDLPREERLYP